MCAKKMLTSALFVLHVSQKLVCSLSQMVFSACLPRGVSSSVPSQFPGSLGAIGYALLVYSAYIFAG